MGREIATGAFLLVSFLSPTPTPAKLALTPVIKIDESQVYTVLPGDSLQSIANKFYDSQDYWVSIWNDNPQISDPNHIEAGWTLKIKNQKPQKEDLSSNLKDRLAALNSQQNKPESIPSSTSSQTLSFKPGSESLASNSVPTNSPSSLNDEQLNFLGNCESGMTANRNSGNGFYGAFQFSPGTWNNMGTGYERADLAPIEVQKDAVQRLLQKSSIYTQFPACSIKMRSLGIL